MDKKRLFVAGVPWSFTSDSLKDLFSQYGEVIEAKVITDRDTGRSKGFGFVSFSNEADAQKAISELDGREIDGRKIVVNIAKPREEKDGFKRGKRYSH